MTKLPDSFYLVNESGYILGVDKDGTVALSSRLGIKCQLWKWDGRRLITNCDMALSITDESDVVARSIDEEDDSYQNWSLKNGILTNKKKGLVLTPDDKNITDGGKLKMASPNSDRKPMWLVEPHLGEIDMDYIIWKEPSEVNPLAVVCYWKYLLGNETKLTEIFGCTVDQYETKVDAAVEKLNTCAEALDRVSKKTGIARATGAGLAIAGGAVSIVGLALTPLTAGISLILTIGGAVLAGLGGITSFTSALVKEGWTNAETNEAKEITNEAVTGTQNLQELMAVYIKRLCTAEDFLKGREIKLEEEPYCRRLYEEGKISNTEMPEECHVDDALNMYRGINTFEDFKSLLNAVGKEFPVLITGVAGEAGPLILSKIIPAFAQGAKTIGGGLSVLGIGFGIWEAIGASDDISNGSEIAEQFRLVATNLLEARKQVIGLYKTLVVIR